jgi:hypothetical protein
LSKKFKRPPSQPIKAGHSDVCLLSQLWRKCK